MKQRIIHTNTAGATLTPAQYDLYDHLVNKYNEFAGNFCSLQAYINAVCDSAINIKNRNLSDYIAVREYAANDF